jgi:alpha-L-fucosidase
MINLSMPSELSRRSLLKAAPFTLLAPSLARPLTAPPGPYGALPSDRQVRWSELELYNFLHFTVNTFTDREWGEGNEDPAVFNPTDFDADQIIETLKSAGSRGVILTCKHHDGFCLWPTKTTDHSIRNSPYLKGRGDVVKEISEAARRQQLPFGVYLSPWDRNQATYGTPQYLPIYRQQMRELLTNYGPIFEIWHDGANGGTGYYGGAQGTRTIDKQHYYDWVHTWELEKTLQSGAAIFSDVGPDVRWVGNEKGIAGETCWATYSPRSPSGGPAAPGDVLEKEATTGTRNGQFWMPAECDVSIRPGWFWHEKENSQVKTPAELMELYYQSVGHGASFLLNVPPDRRGRIHEADAQSLRALGSKLRDTFAKNLAAEARVSASNIRGRDTEYRPQNLLDGNRETYWATDDAVRQAEVAFEWPRPVRFDLVRVREAIRLGQRVDEFLVEVWQNGGWSPWGQGTSIGLCRMVRSHPVEATRVRLRIVKSAACPALSEFSLFRQA